MTTKNKTVNQEQICIGLLHASDEFMSQGKPNLASTCQAAMQIVNEHAALVAVADFAIRQNKGRHTTAVINGVSMCGIAGEVFQTANCPFCNLAAVQTK